MDLIVTYIAFFQALLGIAFIYSKKPQKIPYMLLCILLLMIAVMYFLDILQYYNLLIPKREIISLSIIMLWAPLLYLYTKYISKDYKKFDRHDYLHAVPSLTLILIFIVLKLLPINKNIPLIYLFEKYEIIKILFGFVFIILLHYYVISSVIIIIRFKKQVKKYYSYTISLNWLLVMNIMFYLTLIMVIIFGTIYQKNDISKNVPVFYMHIVELFLAYVISILGFNQNQLDVNPEKTKIENEELIESDRKYAKSGLKKHEAENYLNTLIQYMESTEAWKDPELSIAKLAIQTSIPKHHISEILNKYLGKSFYVFINEYRIEYAKKLLLNKEYNNWSILAIAYECGFNSKAAFNMFFKRVTHLTPSEFKKSINNQ